MIQRLLLVIALMLWQSSNLPTLHTVPMPSDVASIPPVISKLCPYNTICQYNASTRPESIQPSCCSSCSCEKNCHLAGDCCFQPTETVPQRWTKTVCVLTLVKDVKRFKLQPIKYRMVDHCYDSAGSHEIQSYKTQCLNASAYKWGRLQPVYSLATSRTYVNQYCALCNGQSNTVPWISELMCESDDWLDLLFITNRVFKALESPHCAMRFKPPLEINLWRDICFPKMISRCNITGEQIVKNATIAEACLSLRAPYYHEPHVYANVFCYLCNKADERENKCITKDMSGIQNNQLWAAVKFSMLLNLQLFVEGLRRDGHSTSGVCGEHEILVPGTRSCRTVFCPELHRRQNGQCLPIAKWDKTQYVFSVYLHYDYEAEPLSLADLRSLAASQNGITIQYPPRVWTPDLVQLLYIQKTLKGHEVVSALAGMFKLQEPNAQIGSGLKRIVALVNDEWYITIGSKNVSFRPVITGDFFICNFHDFGSPCTILDAPLSLNKSSMYIFSVMLSEETINCTECIAILTKMFFCEQIQLNESEYSFPNQKELLYVTANLYLGPGSYLKAETPSDGVIIRICMDDYLSAFPPAAGDSKTSKGLVLHFSENTILQIVSLSCTFTSILCLIMTIVTFTLVRQLQTQPGLNTACMFGHLLIAQLLYGIGIGQAEPHWLCVTFGIAIHFSWVATLLWMAACCIHVFRSFFALSFMNPSVTIKKTIVQNTLVVYLTTSIFVLCNIVYSLVESDYKRIGYGRKLCYIDTAVMRALTFGLPIALVSLVNLVLFCLVVGKIQVTQSSVSHLARERNYLAIYFRLSSLTGITWLIGFAYEFFPMSALEYVFIILNASQGIFILIAFVCKQDILRFYAGLCRSVSITRE